MVSKLTLSYYPWIKQRIRPAALKAAVGGFAHVLEPALRDLIGNDLRLEVLDALPIPDQLDELKEKPTGEVRGKIALLNPIGYALLHKRVPEVKAVALIRRKIPPAAAGPTYKAQLYTRRGTDIETVAQASGRSMAFGSPQSTSNFLVPAKMLWKAGVHPANGFSRVEFAGGHDTAALAVYEGRADVGAGHDGAIELLKTKYGKPNVDQIMVNLAWSDPITSDPVAVHASDAKLGALIAQALISIAKPSDPKSAGNQAVKAFWDTEEGFETIGADAYASLLTDYMEPLNLREGDMLRKA